MHRSVSAWCLRIARVGLLWILTWPAFGLAGTTATTEAGLPQVDIPVRKVVLYSSGVGYFEHLGSVTGNSSTELHFKTGQINDILKSLVLQDLDGGRVGIIVYPSQDPLTKTLRSFQVDLSGNPSLAELLIQIRGSPVQVMIQGERLQGTILGLEKKPKVETDKEQFVGSWTLILIVKGGIRTVPLDEVQRIELEDAQLQDELHKALSALAQARDQAKKPVLISFEGEGNRRVRVGYIVEAPIWKMSYRLLLPARPEQQAKIQGWAIVENQTDNDWHNAQLSLVSGRPISFVQELYAPLYLPRPVVKPELYAGLRPQTYESGIESSASKAAEQPAPAPPPPPGREHSPGQHLANLARNQDQELASNRSAGNNPWTPRPA